MLYADDTLVSVLRGNQSVLLVRSSNVLSVRDPLHL